MRKNVSFFVKEGSRSEREDSIDNSYKLSPDTNAIYLEGVGGAQRRARKEIVLLLPPSSVKIQSDQEVIFVRLQC